jgi:hypothetical protein
MIKFVGKAWAQKCFMLYLIDKYGKSATLKEVIEKEGK